MTDYIERSLAIQAVTRAKLPDTTPEGVPIANGKRSVTDCIRRIKEVPAEDVANVLYCKDCSYFHAGQGVFYCRLWEKWWIKPDGFCSYGKKMDAQEVDT